MEKVKPDWRLVKVDQTQFCDAAWVEKKGLVSIGMIYLVDANLHVYICSLTPALEAWPVQAFATFKSPELAEADEGEAEMDYFASEEACSYFDTGVLKNSSISAEKYIPEREEDETDVEYRLRIADAVREHLSGNPVDF
jgi:hypothetical protein